ncbi:DUF4328 domain-containing protein [Catellatospora sp. KI3]|uniref:DUF4328 domain-containing protein n=1 Tax=Catellatospora sp. KI3 TaxID=3041620 RepID=UPI00248227C9|nr:DUF4328 domain-containing protein [Catellatospora sp. KI3]MDI1460442.1 DUF4328 domain-containing protein [Catellatospora sp. KI3]
MRGLGVATAIAVVAAAAAQLAAAVMTPLIGRALVEQAAADGGEGVAAAFLVQAVGIFAALAVLLVAGVLVIVWLWRARKNLDAFPGASADLGAGWAIGGWFTPIANFVIPCRLMLQVARESVHRRWVGPVVAVWWAAFLVYQCLGRLLEGDVPVDGTRDYGALSAYFDQELLSGAVSALVFGVAGGCLAWLVYGVSRAQTDRIARGDVLHAYAAYAQAAYLQTAFPAADPSVTGIPADVPAGGQPAAGGTIQV